MLITLLFLCLPLQGYPLLSVILVGGSVVHLTSIHYTIGLDLVSYPPTSLTTRLLAGGIVSPAL